MSFDADSLYRLLPAVHRLRDADRGYPLRQLVEVIAGQVAVLEDELERLYENQFVETADPWALPYLGDLLAITGLPAANLAHTPRAEVANTIAYRRRKGTAAVLELLARDTTGWPARAVEYFERLEATQHLNHRRPHSLATANLRQASRLEFMGGPFEPVARFAEVRRIAPGRGRWNIPNVGVSLWRVQPVSRTAAPLTPDLAINDRRHFRFHPLGLDTPLFNLPVTETDAGTLAGPDNVPLPLTSRRLAGRRWTAGAAGAPPQFHPSEQFYDEGKSVLLLKKSGSEFIPVTPEEIIVSDLRDTTDGSGNPIWAHEAFGKAANVILIDPIRGRVLYPTSQLPGAVPQGSSNLGAALEIGGGEYGRARSLSAALGTHTVIQSDLPAGDLLTTALAAVPPTDSLTIEIGDSGRYSENALKLDATDRTLEIVARDGASPTILLGTRLEISGNASGRVELNGLKLSHREIVVLGSVQKLTLRHCTVIPKAPIKADGSDAFDGLPGLKIAAADVEVVIEDSVLGPIQLAGDTRLTVRRSILLAGSPAAPLLTAADGQSPAGTLRIENSTLIGKIAAHDFELVSNSILVAHNTAPAAAWPAAIWTPRRQTGCVRFTWLPADSLVPRRHQCLPDEDRPNLRPAFTSLAPGHPAFGQLSRLCPLPIRTGADDGSAMGATHDLFEPQREAHLRQRLAEYLRFGLETGAFFES
jgi:hypothetical protein